MRSAPHLPVIMFVVAGFALGVACGPAAEGSNRDEPPAPVSATRDGVRVTIAPTADSFTSAQPNWLVVSVENGRPQGVRYIEGCGSAVALTADLSGAFEHGADWPGLLGRFKTLALGDGFRSPLEIAFTPESMVTRPGEPTIGCPGSLRVVTMQPGETLSTRMLWDGLIAERPAPPGDAKVTASFPFIGVEGVVDPGLTDEDPITTSMQIRVDGAPGAAVMSPALAIDRALADPQFAAWVNAAPEATWINPHIVFTDGGWDIGLFRSGDQDDAVLDMFGEVRIDADGKVVRRRFEPPLQP